MATPISLPDDVALVRTTPPFDETTVPAGLLSAHRIAEGVWGWLVVLDGEVEFTFEDEPDRPHRLGPGDRQVIPPGVRHHIELPGAARFQIEFHR